MNETPPDNEIVSQKREFDLKSLKEQYLPLYPWSESEILVVIVDVPLKKTM